MTNLASAPAYGRPGVLLTGATGFLGGYLLKELVERTEMPIYCLTRSDGTLGARARLMDNLHFLFGADAVEAWPLERIAIVEGDLAKERFGLSEAGYAELAEHTGAVFHAAAMLWHFGKLEQFLKVNVQGTENLLAFCSAGMPKTLNHISTLAVSGRRCDNPKNLFTEADFHESMECPNVYVETKYEAEKRLRPAMLAGHAVRIFRPGFIMGDSKTGRFKKHITSDAQYLHLQGHIFMRTAPPLYDDDYMDLTPVDMPRRPSSTLRSSRTRLRARIMCATRSPSSSPRSGTSSVTTGSPCAPCQRSVTLRKCLIRTTNFSCAACKA